MQPKIKGSLKVKCLDFFCWIHGHLILYKHLSIQPMWPREEESYNMGLSKKFFFLFIMDRHMEPLGGGARSTKSEEVPQFLVFAWSSVEV